MDIATATPAQIDGEIARINALVAIQHSRFDRAQRALKSEYVSHSSRVQANKVIDEATAALAELRTEETPLHDEYIRRGTWNRYYLVEGGHLHYDCTWGRCSRIPSTRHYFMTDLSGMTADEAIELAGDRVCTTCFPQAPVAAQERPSKLLTADEQAQAQAREERAQKAAEKAAKAKANAILDPETGEALEVSTGGRYTETFKTERAAWIHMVDQMWCQRFYTPSEERTEVISKITRAIAAKNGVAVDEIRAQAIKKLEARIKREERMG